MKRLAILAVLVACTNPALSRTEPDGPSIAIPGAKLDDVRDAVVSQLTSKGYSVLVAEKFRVAGELPIRSDWSGNFYSHRDYRLGENQQGVTVTAGAWFVDKSPPPVHYSQSREAAKMALQGDFGADLAAIRRQFLH